MFLDGNFLAIGSHDNCIYIHAVSDSGRKYARVGRCSVSGLVGTGRGGRGRPAGPLVTSCAASRQGHSSFITHLDWSVDSQYLVSNSGDYEILYCEWERAREPAGDARRPQRARPHLLPHSCTAPASPP